MSKLALLEGTPVRTKPLHPWPFWDEKEEKALLEVLHSGKWWFGEKVEEFEAKYAAWQGAKYGVACSTGTAALQVAVRALGLGFGATVLRPAQPFDLELLLLREPLVLLGAFLPAKRLSEAVSRLHRVLVGHAPSPGAGRTSGAWHRAGAAPSGTRGRAG